MTARAVALFLLALGVSGCGYFNALYNAQLRFTAAEQAEREGNRAAAMSAYDEAINRAFVSYDKYPNSRWADDALLLIARARFARGETRQSAAALERLLRESSDATVRSRAHAYLGASRVRLGLADALPPLDSAVAASEPGSDFGAFSRLWRARARFAAGDTAGAWQDLDEADAGDPQMTADARVEALARATTMRDSIQWERALPILMTQGTPLRWNDSVRALIQAGATQWNPRFVAGLMPGDVGERLVEQQRLRLRQLRAELLATAGDTAAAIQAAIDVAGESSSDVSSQARVSAARWILATADSVAAVSRARAILLPAFSWSEALQLIQRLRAIEVLIDRSPDAPVAMFVAAELARDEVDAPGLARELFLQHALAGDVWSGKALLAALHLSGTDAERDEVQRLLVPAGDNVYLRAVRGTADPDVFEQAESTLRRDGSALRAEALALGVSGDLSVGRALAVRDSIRRTGLRDSLVARCNVLVDSTAVAGVRRDSTRAACLRNDTARVNIVLRIDTLLLKPPRDSTNAPPDTTSAR